MCVPINFNIERLDKLLCDFHRLTGLTISIWDAEFHQLSYQPKEMRGFCRLLKSTPEGRRRCFESDKALCMECASTGAPATHLCHAGLLDTAIPIRFKDTVMGYMMFGQATDGREGDVRSQLSALCRELRIDYNTLSGEYHRLEPYDRDRIAAAASILKMATRYLWLSEYIELGYNTVAARIDDYIHTHLAEPLSVKELCHRFALSKNRLYALSHECFGMPIGDYIIATRMGEAKRLLAMTDLSVAEIGEAIGIRDYNYFTKFFKQNAGVPPLRYRKTAQRP